MENQSNWQKALAQSLADQLNEIKQIQTERKKNLTKLLVKSVESQKAILKEFKELRNVASTQANLLLVDDLQVTKTKLLFLKERIETEEQKQKMFLGQITFTSRNYRMN